MPELAWRYSPALWKDQDKLRSLLHKERGWQCECCHDRQWTDLHHCLFHRMKRYPQFDAAVNIACLCHDCHMSGLGDATEFRNAFREVQEDRGYDVRGWIEGLPTKVKCR